MDLFSATSTPLAAEATADAVTRLLTLVQELPEQQRDKLTASRFAQGVEEWREAAFLAREVVHATPAGEATWLGGVEQVREASRASVEGLWTGPWDAAMNGVAALLARPSMGQRFTFKHYGQLAAPLRAVGLRVHPDD
jgi:hypothetical protein